jgi:hypothetical protein
MLTGLVAISSAQGPRAGVYQPTGSSGTPWKIDDTATLQWGGQPYMPIGATIDGTPESIKLAAANGVKDVVVDLPASGQGWNLALDALKAANLRYLIRIASLSPMAQGFAVEPQAYRMLGILKPQTVSLPLANATGAFVVVASRRDGSVQSSARVPVVNGTLTYDIKGIATDYEYILYVYPEMSSLEQPDYWNVLDQHRDTLLTAFKRSAPGPGLRGIINPLGRTVVLPGNDIRFVPTNPYFHLELRQFLEQKYRNLETALRGWSMSASDFSAYDEKNVVVNGFDKLARLVPLWSGTKGLGQLLDPVTNKLYTADLKKSAAWRDIAATVNAAAARRYDRLVNAIRTVVNVPVVQEWAGWSAPYENPTPALDGIAMRTSGNSLVTTLDTASRAASSLTRWSNRGWLLASDLDFGASPDLAARVSNTTNDLYSLGSHAIFIHASDAATLKVVAAEDAGRNRSSADLASLQPPLYFPENAYGTASIQKLPGGRWWLPAPMDGDNFDLGPDFRAYRMVQNGQTAFVVWTLKPGRVKFMTSNPKTIRVTSLDGVSPDIRIAKKTFELTMTQYPLVFTDVDQIPVPQTALDATVKMFTDLQKASRVEHGDIVEEDASFRNYLTGLDANPGGNFLMLRRVLQRVEYKMGSYSWLEAERNLDNNFSEAREIPGCSDDRALVLRTPLPSAAGFYADYNVSVRTTGDQDVWISARIPADRRSDVQMIVGGQVLTISQPPVSGYGDHFAWYNLGKTRLSGNQMKIKLVVLNGTDADFAFDSILLTPDVFTPDGIRLPSANR